MKLDRMLATLLLGLAAAGGCRAGEALVVATYPNLDRVVRLVEPVWRQRHPDVPIKLVARSYADHHTAMTTALAAGSGLPDLMAIEVSYVARFAASGALTDLNAPPFSAERWRDDYPRYAWAQASSGKRLAALPVDIGPGTLFYRQDLLAAAGVKDDALSRSWESYLDAGRKLKARSVYLMAHARDLKDLYLRANLKDGEGVYFDGAGKPQVRSPRFEKAFELALTARKAGLDARLGAYSTAWGDAIRKGRIATQASGSWMAGHLETWLAPQTRGLWRVTAMPAGAHATWGGSFYAIPQASKQKALAWELLQLLAHDRDTQLAALKNKEVNAFPALIAAQDDPLFASPVEFLGGQRAWLLWRASANAVPALAANRNDALAEEIVNNELDAVLLQGKSIATALADAERQIVRRARR
ncbi:ABC transporter substrate-binding protein [Chitinolyticbacter meiyuanensis]|uniref:ABC transporter substrate-binding protein n=1 Tax=Chitinolyticbacter meiyuanensis TaxID=682798 RepID=UPI0011E5F374|nr:extracellular solute-binding protein [Chitinolyticbacter meiyuanensis]